MSGATGNKWSVRYQNVRYVGTGPGALNWVDYNLVYLQLSATGADAGPNEVNYTNAPSDISDSLGRQLAAFSGFAF